MRCKSIKKMVVSQKQIGRSVSATENATSAKILNKTVTFAIFVEVKV